MVATLTLTLTLTQPPAPQSPPEHPATDSLYGTDVYGRVTEITDDQSDWAAADATFSGDAGPKAAAGAAADWTSRNEDKGGGGVREVEGMKRRHEISMRWHGGHGGHKGAAKWWQP